MANNVEIGIQARDNTGPAMQSALNNSKKLSGEVKSLGGALNQVGNIASAFGNQHLAGLTAQAGIVANSFRSMREVILKVGLLKGSLIGVALAMAGWVAQRAIAERQRIAEKIEEEKKAHKELAASIEKTALAQKTLNERIAEGAIGASKGGAMKESLETLAAHQAARKAGVVIGDPITPLGTNPVKDAMAIKPADVQKQLEEARKLVEDHHNKQWELYDEIYEARKLKDDEAMERAEEQAKRQQELIDEQARRENQSLIAARSMDMQMDVEKQEKFAKLRAQEDADHEERLRKIAELNLEEEKSIDLAIKSGRLKTQKLVGIDRLEQKEKILNFSKYAEGYAQISGSLASLAATQGKKGFKISQALRYGEAIMSTASGIARAYADYAWPYSMIVAAIVGAAGAAQIGAIASAKGPQAHGGVESVPQDQTVLLQQGERVIKRDQNKRLMEIIDGEGGGGGAMINLTVLLDSLPIMKAIGQASRDGRLTISARAVA